MNFEQLFHYLQAVHQIPIRDNFMEREKRPIALKRAATVRFESKRKVERQASRKGNGIALEEEGRHAGSEVEADEEAGDIEVEDRRKDISPLRAPLGEVCLNIPAET
ncbi:hypothetical protein MMC18_002690 [Xylographa bjoerkii]|nr:hypothetical protein [Xylographa bjoerkii]